MAHYAFLDENNIVTEVIVGIDENELIEGKSPEIWYGEFRGQKCVRTSYNTIANKHLYEGVPYRKNFAAIGYIFDESLDAFLPPKPYPSWILDENSYLWKPPVEKPDTSPYWNWDEENQQWTEKIVASE